MGTRPSEDSTSCCGLCSIHGCCRALPHFCFIHSPSQYSAPMIDPEATHTLTASIPLNRRQPHCQTEPMVASGGTPGTIATQTGTVGRQELHITKEHNGTEGTLGQSRRRDRRMLLQMTAAARIFHTSPHSSSGLGSQRSCHS